MAIYKFVVEICQCHNQVLLVLHLNMFYNKRFYTFSLLIFLLFIPQYVLMEESWTGKWFPARPTPAPKIDSSTRIPMGKYNASCDNAKINLTVDWFDDSTNYTCFDNKDNYLPDISIRPLYEIEQIPKGYSAPHACMSKKLIYSEVIPTFGPHRPLWGKWGEYKFLPKQRWIHNLEHGGIVMLYHPCANKLQVEKLKNIVKSCLYRHIITPYNLLSPSRPIALVAWGRRLQMSVVSEKVTIQFIKDNALRGPEGISRDGQYDYGLINHADIVSTIDDDTLCSKY